MPWRYGGLFAAVLLFLLQYASAADLRLTVLDAISGEPISGAGVVIRAHGDYPAVGQTTAADGGCLIHTANKTSYVSLLVRHDGHVTTTLVWQAPQRETVQIPPAYTLKLPRCKPISGRVLDAYGQPIPFAHVYLSYWPSTDDLTQQPQVAPRLPDEEVQTDEEGLWTYAGAPTDALDKLTIRVEHDDFIKTGDVRAPKPADLLNATAKTVLQAGVKISGAVVDAGGKAIANARVTTQRTYYVSNDYGITTRTDAQGHFTLPHQAPGELPVTVMAKGYSPQMQMVSVKPGLQPLQFTLAPGRTIKGLAVDGAGKPLAGVDLAFDGWRGICPIPWRTSSRADGTFQIPDAPSDDFTLRASKEGYNYKFSLAVGADDSTVTVKMTPMLHLSGHVVDAQSGKPIERFKVIPGLTFWQGWPPSFEFDRALEAKQGEYRIDLQEADSAIGLYLRIEAEGHEPFVSPPLRESGKLDAQLNAARPLAGTLRNPDGTAARDVEVHLVLPGANASLMPTSERAVTGALTKTKTGEDGTFSLPPQNGVFDLIAFASAGYLVQRLEAAKPLPDLKLTPWAAVEGTYTPDGRPQASELFLTLEAESAEGDIRYFWSCAPRCDEQGHYQVDRLPAKPGVSLLQIGQLDEDRDQRRILPVHLESGKVARADVQAAGTSILKGRVTAGRGETPVDASRGMVRLVAASKLPVADWPEDSFQALQLARPAYWARLAADGSFSIPAVPPGNYEYSVMLGAGQHYGVACGQCVVAPDHKETDLGLLYYTGTRSRPGEALPEILATLPDGRPIRTADFAGKYVVLAMWTLQFGKPPAYLPALEQLGQSFAANSQVALVSVNTDPISGAENLCRRPSRLKSTSWVQGHITLSQYGIVTRLFTKDMPILLIAGRDGKIVANGLKAEDIEAKLKELLTQ